LTERFGRHPRIGSGGRTDERTLAQSLFKLGEAVWVPTSLLCACPEGLVRSSGLWSSRRGRRQVQFILAIELHADLDARAALGSTVAVGVPQRIHTAAVFLLIEVLALAD